MYEYEAQETGVNAKDVTKVCNEMVDKGWEFVSFTARGGLDHNYLILFRRPKRPTV